MTAAVAASTAAAAGATAARTGATAVSSLAGNFTDFLQLLMTQLQNQDPTAPMDTNQFTSQLVQFSSVEQQINTNSSLTKLIEATQGANLLQSTSLVGQQVEVSGDRLSLQDGTAAVRMNASGAGQATIGVYTPAGVKVRESTVPLAAGSNNWTWDGKSDAGAKLADGAYKVVVANTDGSAQPFTVVGTATGVQRSNDAMTVSLGALQVDFAKVQSVGAHTTP